jgi:hypothetical protein
MPSESDPLLPVAPKTASEHVESVVAVAHGSSPEETDGVLPDNKAKDYLLHG